MDKPPNINMFFARMLIDRLVNEGVNYFVISPGSRSTPLTIAAAEHPDVTTKIIIDERSAAFYALGYARSSGNAPGLICTSGTAAANYFPAVIEAYQSRLPLIVLSADRPGELQNIGANQTIQQRDIFGSFAVSETFEAPDDDLDPVAILDSIEIAVKGTWIQGRLMSMPLHLNCRFREPLAPQQSPYPYDRLRKQVAAWYKGRPVDLTGYSQPDYADEVELLAHSIENCARGIIIVGQQSRYRSCTKFGAISEKLKWPIVADILSQSRFTTQENPGHLLGAYDLYLDAPGVLDHLKPEMILHLGGLPTSKRLNQFLLACKGIPHIKIQSHASIIDPDGVQTHRIIADEDAFIEQLRCCIKDKTDTTWLSSWVKTDYISRTAINQFVADNRLNEVSLPPTVVELIPTKEALFVSSSMPVRDFDSFAPVSHKAVQVGANRGASGIDGIISSACGFSAGCERPTTVVLGDLACLHDIGSLKLIGSSAKPIIAIVINNNGGGIFHFLPIAEHDEIFETHFATPQNVSFASTAAMAGLPYSTPTTIDEFKQVFEGLLKSNSSGLIEIAADRKENVELHNSIRRAVHDAIGEK